MPFLLLIAALSALALLGVLVLSFVPSFRASRARGMSASVGLALTEDIRPAVERALGVRLRATALGGLVGLALGVVAAVTSGSGDFAQWLLLAGFFLGIGLGSAIGAFVSKPRPNLTGTRVAHSRDVRLRDYVMPIELTGARIVVGVAIVIGAGVSLLLAGNPRETTSLASLVVVTILALVALLAFEVVGRAVVRQASPAEDPTRLAWEDALRADTLRALVTAPLTFGCAAVVLGAVGSAGVLPLTPLSITLGFVAPMAVFAAAIAIAVIALAGKPQQHYLRILWPETAAAISR